MKKYELQPSDLHLLFNLVNSSESFKTAESWTPICLPLFNPRSVFYFLFPFFSNCTFYYSIFITIKCIKAFFKALSSALRHIAAKVPYPPNFSALLHVIFNGNIEVMLFVWMLHCTPSLEEFDSFCLSHLRGLQGNKRS